MPDNSSRERSIEAKRDKSGNGILGLSGASPIVNLNPANLQPPRVRPVASYDLQSRRCSLPHSRRSITLGGSLAAAIPPPGAEVDTYVKLDSLLALLENLLNESEVKFARNMLGRMSSILGAVTLSITHKDLIQELEQFADEDYCVSVGSTLVCASISELLLQFQSQQDGKPPGFNKRDSRKGGGSIFRRSSAPVTSEDQKKKPESFNTEFIIPSPSPHIRDQKKKPESFNKEFIIPSPSPHIRDACGAQSASVDSNESNTNGLLPGTPLQLTPKKDLGPQSEPEDSTAPGANDCAKTSHVIPPSLGLSRPASSDTERDSGREGVTSDMQEVESAEGDPIKSEVSISKKISRERISEAEATRFTWRARLEGMENQRLRTVTFIDDLEDLSLEQMEWLSTPSDRWIAHPIGLGRIIWDFGALVCILFECITLPLSVAFAMELPGSVHHISTTFFASDILMNLTTGYFRGSLLIMRRYWLTMHYLKTWFTLDLVSTIPWEALVSLVERGQGESDREETAFLRVLKLGKLLRVVRLLRFAKVATLMKRLQQSGLYPANMYQLKFGMAVGRMCVVFCLLSHWMACVWGWLGDAENIDASLTNKDPYDMETCTMGGPCERGLLGSPWRRRYGLENYSKGSQYLAALQYTAALITGGEAAMHAGYSLERLFTIVLMMSSVFICSIVVGEILLLMNRQAEINMTFDELMVNAREFMVSRRIPVNLQARIYKYLVAQRKADKGVNANNRDFIEHLSSWLQIELVDCMNRRHICRHPFFKQVSSVHLLIRRICLEAAPIIYGPGDTVVEVGTVAKFMSFLVRGRLRVEVNENGGGGLFLTPPSWIGDKCLFVDTLRTNTVRSVTTSEMLNVDKTSVRLTCMEFPDILEIWERFRSEILLNGLKTLRCPNCHDIGHTEEACPKTAFQEAEQMMVTRSVSRLRFPFRAPSLVPSMSRPSLRPNPDDIP